MPKPHDKLLQAKMNMDAADTMHDYLCQTYGERSDVAMYGLQASIDTFMVFCELERLMSESD